MAWQAAGFPPIRMAVNLSARQFRQQQLLSTINQVLSETGLDPKCLELELTESMMQGTETSDILNELENTGIHLVIDDFGMGYSSLSYLKRFPVTKLKIDQSFVQGIPDDADDMAITTAIVAMAHSLKLQVIAEGVETMRQLEFLRSLKCNEMQGYYFSMPLPPSEVEECFAQDYATLPLVSIGGNGFSKRN
jgi:EAL domain-containing protein (putative c-di-GMP-specific phosphodiesterase class I)